MVKIWCSETFEDRPYDPNFPIDRDLGFHWRQYLFDKQSIPSSDLSFKISQDIRKLDYFEGELIPIVSEKIKNILTHEIPQLVDFFPVKILEYNRKVEITNFFIIKINND